MHPEFIQILEITRKHHMIPSYTTNGQGMTDEIYNATKCYCGAMAVSWYEPYSEATQMIKKLSRKRYQSQYSLPSAPKQYTSCNRDATKTPSVSSTGQRHCVLKLQARPLSTFVMLDGYM